MKYKQKEIELLKTELKIGNDHRDLLQKELCRELIWREEENLKLKEAITLLCKAAAIMERGESGKGLAAQIRKKYYSYGARA